METASLLVIGALGGLIAGLVGIAGGIVIVPALTWIFGAAAIHDAVVVSWFAVFVNSLGAVSKQYQVRTPEERRAIYDGAKYFCLGLIIATPVAALLVSHVKQLITPLLVGLLQICLAIAMLKPVHETGVQVPRQNPPVDAVFGAIIGATSTVIGIGGGTYTIAYFVYVGKRKFQEAIATANFAGTIVGLLCILGFVISLALEKTGTDPGPISAGGMFLLIVAGAISSPLGVKLSRKMKTIALRRIIIFALLISAIRLLTV